jgi:hypothetical protein
MFCFFKKGMNNNYFAILTASLNRAVFVLNVSKNIALFHLQHKMIGFLKGMNINYFAILNASLNKAIFVLNLSKKQHLLPLKT